MYYEYKIEFEDNPQVTDDWEFVCLTFFPSDDKSRIEKTVWIFRKKLG
jgi:hypothetical protein